jgi:hypothetical protein
MTTNTNDRNYQLQGSYTRYYDGRRIGFGTIEGPNKRRNYKTLESAIRAAKKELRNNDHPKVVRCEHEYYGPRSCDYHLHSYAEDGHEFTYGEDYEFWHVDALRIVDRETQKVLWES